MLADLNHSRGRRAKGVGADGRSHGARVAEDVRDGRGAGKEPNRLALRERERAGVDRPQEAPDVGILVRVEEVELAVGRLADLDGAVTRQRGGGPGELRRRKDPGGRVTRREAGIVVKEAVLEAVAAGGGGVEALDDAARDADRSGVCPAVDKEGDVVGGLVPDDRVDEDRGGAAAHPDALELGLARSAANAVVVAEDAVREEGILRPPAAEGADGCTLRDGVNCVAHESAVGHLVFMGAADERDGRHDISDAGVGKLLKRVAGEGAVAQDDISIDV